MKTIIKGIIQVDYSNKNILADNGVPVNTPTATEPQAYIDTATGVLYVWSGATWTLIGAGATSLTDNLDGTYTFDNGDGNVIELDFNAAALPFSPTMTIAATDVQGAIEELEADSHVAVTVDDSLSDALSITGQELQFSNIELIADLGLENIASVIGVGTFSSLPYSAVDLGTFTGTILSNNLSIKEALQELETQIETIDLLTTQVEFFPSLETVKEVHLTYPFVIVQSQFDTRQIDSVTYKFKKSSSGSGAAFSISYASIVTLQAAIDAATPASNEVVIIQLTTVFDVLWLTSAFVNIRSISENTF